MLASVSAALIASPLVLQSAPHSGTPFMRDLFWPDILTPYLVFSAAFIGVVPVLLGYYHLGRLGFLVSLAVGLALGWSMPLCALLCFALTERCSGSRWLGAIPYLLCFLLLYLLIAKLHFRAVTSTSLREAQTKLHLMPYRLL